MLTLAEAQRKQGRFEEAQATLDQCRAICVERFLTGVEVEVLREQAELHAAVGRFDQALETYKVFHTEVLSLNSNRREAAARTRDAMFGTEEGHEESRRFWLQVRTDALTGLPNRRRVNEELPGRLNDVLAGVPMVVAAFDADHFKDVNDALSHEVGDIAIRELGRLLEATLVSGYAAPQEPPSFVARLGGDEFLAVLPGLELRAATTVLETMRGTVEAHPWRPSIGDLRLTVSVDAVAAFATDTPSNLLTRADFAAWPTPKKARQRACSMAFAASAALCADASDLKKSAGRVRPVAWLGQ